MQERRKLSPGADEPLPFGAMANTLGEQIGSEDKRAAVVDDCLEVLDAEVGDKGGLSGVAIKSAYKLVKGIRPGFIREVVNHLLDDFLAALDPIYQESVEKDAKPSAHLVANKSRMADSLLAVTDKRAERAKMALIKKTYSKLRPSAQKHVEAAAPRLGQLLDRHAAPS